MIECDEVKWKSSSHGNGHFFEVIAGACVDRCVYGWVPERL